MRKSLLGKHHSTDTKKKIRLKSIERIKNSKGQVMPNYNPQACKIIDDYGRNHNYSFRHAENGGEFYIKELGYWVDGYDDIKNVVIEVDEPTHYTSGELKKKDLARQKEIEDFLKCKFIRIKI